MRTDTIGNYEKSFLIKCKHATANATTGTIYCSTSDGNFLYFGGKYKDSVTWVNKAIAPEYLSSADHDEFFIASLTKDLKPRWFYRPKVLDKSDPYKAGNYIGKVSFSKGLLYFGESFNSEILIDSNILFSKKAQEIY